MSGVCRGIEYGRVERQVVGQCLMQVCSPLQTHQCGVCTYVAPSCWYWRLLCLSLSGKGKKQEEDTFGMNDEDWSVYREIVSPHMNDLVSKLALGCSPLVLCILLA